MKSSGRRPLALIFGFVFIELLGYSLILPLLPYYAEGFGATLTVVGLLGTANALAQLVAAPTIGRLSDRYGRRPLLIFSAAATVVSFLILGLARSLWMVLLSRVTDGLFGGNVALARAYIADVTDERNRARGMGIIGAAFGLGFIIGPALGGFLSRWGYHVPALLAAALATVSLISVALFLPESTTPETRARMRTHPRTAFSLSALWEALHLPCCATLLQIALVQALAFTLFQSNFALWAKARLGLTAQATSFVLTYVGLLSVTVQGFAIGRLTARFAERSLIYVAAAGLSVSLLAWGFTPRVWWLVPILALVALSGGVLGTVLTSQLTKAVRPEEVGGILGLATSLQTLSQIVAPALGGFLLSRVGTWSPGLLAGLLMLVAVVLAGRGLSSVPQARPPTR